MPAKKNIIKDLRAEITQLKDEMKVYKQGMRQRERHFARKQRDHEFDLVMINKQTNNIASSLKHRFLKELTWLELCDDQDSKFQIVKGAIESLQLIANPDEDDDGY